VPIIDAHEPWLTLIGLRLVWERNVSPGAAPGGSIAAAGGSAGPAGPAGAAGGSAAGRQETDVPKGAIAGNLRA
jgi:hypothetical protein